MRWLALAMVVVLGCGQADAGGDDAIDTPEVEANDARWNVAIADMPGALLSVWGDGARWWAAGADVGDGSGPMLVQGTVAGGWRRIDGRARSGHLWWVFGAPGSDRVTIVGEGGRVLRVHGETGAIVEDTSVGDATLYGVWGASDAVMWAVGGYVYPRVGPPTIVKLTAGGSEVVALPPELPESGTFFKVWGTAANDVWVVGEKGMVVHFDGVTWTNASIASGPRLVTINGRGDDLVAVGGVGAGVLFEGTGFVERVLSGVAPLNGVVVSAGGEAWAVGMLNQVLHRTGGAWEAVTTGLPGHDWHAVWVDPRGDVWVVGGELLSRLDRGTLLRFGPERSDVPSGTVIPIHSITEPAAEVVETVETSSAETIEAVEAVEAVEVIDDVEVIEDVIEAAEAIEEIGPDAGPEIVEVGEVGDVVETEIVEQGFEVGAIVYPEGVFTPFSESPTFNIVHGPQGGIHVEIAVRFGCEAPGPALSAAVYAGLSVDDMVAATFESNEYPMQVLGSVCQSYVMPLIFAGPDAAPYVGKTGYLAVRVTVGEQTFAAALEGPLRDAF